MDARTRRHHGLVTDPGPDAAFDLFVADLPLVVPGPVGPLRVVLLDLATRDGAWRLHYAATGKSDRSIWIEAEDEAGNEFDVRSGGYSRGDDAPIVGWWTLRSPTEVRPGVLRLKLFFDESSPIDEWEGDVEAKRARARARADILHAQLLVAENRQFVAELMYASDEQSTAIAQLIAPPLELSELQAHYVADLSLRRLTQQSRRLIEEELRECQAQLRDLDD